MLQCLPLYSIGMVMGATAMLKSRKFRETVYGYLFILPNLIGFSLLSLFAIIFSFILSFTNWDMQTGLQNIKFIGIQNFIDIFTDATFKQSIVNNFYFVIFIPIEVFITLAVASMINRSVYFDKLWRVILYLPSITNVVIITTVWMMLLRPDDGVINNMLMAIGIKNPPGWLSSPEWVKPSIVLMYMWSVIGYYVIMYIAALKSISKELYEASGIDGASKMQQFFRITVPMVSPVTFYIIIMETIAVFKTWTHVQILTGGGPGGSSNVIGYYIYKSAFNYGKMGYASAMSWVLLLIILIITYFQWQGQKKWVNYY